MALYEHVFIARSDISPQQVEQLSEQVKALISGKGGSIAKDEYWGLRNLAYRIKKHRKGHYVLMNLEAPAAAVAELERQHKINEDILRFITVRVDAHEDGPSAGLRAREREERRRERDERGRDDRGDRGERGERGERGDRGERGGRFDRDDRRFDRDDRRPARGGNDED